MNYLLDYPIHTLFKNIKIDEHKIIHYDKLHRYYEMLRVIIKNNKPVNKVIFSGKDSIRKLYENKKIWKTILKNNKYTSFDILLMEAKLEYIRIYQFDNEEIDSDEDDMSDAESDNQDIQRRMFYSMFTTNLKINLIYLVFVIYTCYILFNSESYIKHVNKFNVNATNSTTSDPIHYSYFKGEVGQPWQPRYYL